MAQTNDYQSAIESWLSNPELDDYEGFTKLAKLYRKLHTTERAKMEAGLSLVIEETNDHGLLADAIHLAYHLSLFSDAMQQAIDSRKHLREMDSGIAREIDNFDAYQTQTTLMMMA